MESNFLLLKIFLYSLLAFGTFANNKEQHPPNLVELAEQLNLNKFVEALKESGMSHLINHEGPFTVFAPTDEAFENEKKYHGEAPLKEKIQFHIGKGRFDSNSFQDEMIIKSTLPQRTIRINKYDNGQITANGRPIKSMDNKAHNGFIHVVSEVMSSVYQKSGSVVSELSECCPQHSTLLDLIKYSQLFNVLDKKEPITLLAPLNGAFAELHPDYIIHLKQNVTKLRMFLMNHVIRGTVYSAGLSEGETIQSVAHTKFKIHFDQDGTLNIENAKVSVGDVTAVNGAVHSIDKVLFLKPSFYEGRIDRDSSLVNVLHKFGFTKIAKALQDTKLDQVIEEKGVYTIFAPTDDDFEKAASTVEDMETHLRKHIGRGLVKASKIKAGRTMLSLMKNYIIRFDVDSDGTVRENGNKIINLKGYQTGQGLIYPIQYEN